MKAGSRKTQAIVVPIVLALLVLAAERAGLLTIQRGSTPPASAQSQRGAASAGPGAEIVAAFREKRSDVWVEAEGDVIKVLGDDTDGVRHQKFLVRVEGAEGLTVLIAHNLDAAERVPVREGDRVRFRGEYEWTEKGGTVHFTHAPELARRDPGGWIVFNGKRYE